MEKDTGMNKKIIMGTLIGCFFGATVGYSAAVINVPHTFTAGTSIKASEVNANFAALAQDIASVKNSVSLYKSSDFSETLISPISTTASNSRFKKFFD
jgi:gas vesicle protein